MTIAILQRSGNRLNPPRISAQNKPFWEALQEGKFLVTACKNCSRLSFPPRSVCPACSHQELDWQEVSGRGKLYSLTTVHAGPPDLMANGPYSGAIIDLDENIRLVTEWIGDPSVKLDTAVELVITRYDDGCLFAARSA